MGKISVELYGESHSAKIGVRIKGVAAGTYVDEEEISALLERRRAVKAAYSTPRLEKDGYEGDRHRHEGKEQQPQHGDGGERRPPYLLRGDPPLLFFR